MKFIVERWKNVSIAKKLYFVVGIMAILIAGELLTLRFSMKKLSAVRAFVGGESLWSKAQKNAIFRLHRFGITHSESDYQAFLTFLKVPAGDHQARVELLKKNPNIELIRKGFRKGRIDEQDIDPMIDLLRKFYWISYLSDAISIWTRADDLLFQLEQNGISYHQAVRSKNKPQIQEDLTKIKVLNEKLTALEEDFSKVLGDGSRWLEHVVLSVLTLVVLTVETIGLSLAIATTRAISKGLRELNDTADAIGKGDFNRKVKIHSTDEIGKLGEVVNAMGGILKKSYRDLERRVEERTADLATLASENKKLYEEAKAAVHIRDEFLSIASHELKTPLTSLGLQIQIAKMHPTPEKLVKVLDISEKQVKRLTGLVQDLLDTCRWQTGKLAFQFEPVDISEVAKDTSERLLEQFQRARCEFTSNIQSGVMLEGDHGRMEQVIDNLLSNAIKYSAGAQVSLSLKSVDDKVHIVVNDRGPGIPKDRQSKIFERYERATASRSISGLGLGLFIVKEIVKGHSGTISVESDLGQGAKFTVELPVHRTMVAQTEGSVT